MAIPSFLTKKNLLSPYNIFPIAYIIALFFFSPVVQVFGVIILALYLFTTEKLPVDITAILIMLLLMLLQLVTPEQGVSGFSSTATITVLCMFILSGGIAKTGIIQKLGHKVFKFTKKSQTIQLLIIALIVAPISGIFNNTAAVAIFLPMVINLSKTSKTPATKLLIPLSFLSMLGGTLTLVGTSTNILANSILLENGLETFNMFSFIHIGAIVLVVGVLYMLTLGRLLLPKRKNEQEEHESDDQFLTEVEIQRKSSFIGRHLKDINFLNSPNIKVIKVLRGEKSYVKDMNHLKLKEDDILVIIANEQKIIEFDRRENEKVLLNFNERRRRMSAGSARIVKVVVPSIFHKKTLGQIRFWDRFQAAVIGLSREDLDSRRLASIPLKKGEIVLIKASQSSHELIRNSKDLVLIEELELKYDRKKSWTALSIMALVVLLAALNVMTIMVAAILGVVLMFITRCLKTKEIYNSVSWDVIFLLAGLIPLGIAMQESGAADLIANLIVDYAEYLSPFMLFGAFYLITTLLTEVISNNAAVVLLVPIALSVADKLALNPISLTLIVMFAASTSFLSPVGYQTNTMVYSVGNYKFSDFIKVGLFLNLILLFVTSFLVYVFFGV